MPFGRRRIFISATSSDLGSYRVVAENSILNRGYVAVTQDNSSLTSLDIQGKLTEMVSTCDAVICLVGTCYGSEPDRQPTGVPPRSFTQSEFYVATQLGKPVYLLLSAPETVFDKHETEAEELRLRQSAYRESIIQDRDWTTFRDREELRNKIGLLRFPWEKSNWRRVVSRVVAPGLLGVVGWYAWTRSDEASRFKLFAERIQMGVVPPPSPPGAAPPVVRPELDAQASKLFSQGQLGPAELRFRNRSSKDFIVTILDPRSMRYKTTIELPRGGIVACPGGVDLHGYCHFVIRTPDEDIPAGWHYLRPAPTQAFVFEDDQPSIRMVEVELNDPRMDSPDLSGSHDAI